MEKRLSLVAIACTVAGSLIGCDPAPLVDAGPCPPGVICLDAGPDGGRDAGRDAQIVVDPCDFTRAGNAIGSACRTGSTCADPFQCLEETPGGYPSVNTGTCTAGPNIMGTISPNGGECTELCSFNDNTDPCGDCGGCSAVYLGPIGFAAGQDPATGEYMGACRPSCTPSLTDNGGCRTGYTCSPTTHLCVEACPNDEWCKYVLDDCDGDGEGELVYMGDTYPAQCNTTTGRCETMGTAGAMIGGPCDEATDCTDNGYCLTGDAFPGGYCTRFGCNAAGFECGAGAVCDVRNFGEGASGCLDACTVAGAGGVDLGAGGHGDGCPAGFQCTWDGLTQSATGENGGCLPGEFNAITTPNVGGACQTAADCWSPYGYGDCWFAEGQTDRDTPAPEVNSGICVVNNCIQDMPGALPGAGTIDLCDETAGEVCAWVGGPMESPTTACLQGCTSATACPTGYACNAFGTQSFCWPFCEASTECRTGQQCLTGAGAACAAGEDCFCQPSCASDADCSTVPGRTQCEAGRCVECENATDVGCGGTETQCVANACVTCDPADDGGCSGTTTQCNPTTNTCVACVADGAAGAQDSGCDVTNPQCNATTNTCQACDPADHSGCTAPLAFCDASSGTATCVACITDSQCTAAGLGQCAGNVCRLCDPTDNAGCTDATLNVCDPTTYACVDCVADTDCTAPATCVATVCTP